MNLHFFPSPLTRQVVKVLTASAIALGLTACDKMKEPTTGERIDSAIEKTEDAAAKAQSEARSAMDSAKREMQEGAAKTEAAAGKAGEAMRDAGNSAMALVDDASITAQVSAGLAKDPALSAIRIDVDTHAGAVRLSGPAPTEMARERATAIAQGVKGVVSVVNELRVTPG